MQPFLSSMRNFCIIIQTAMYSKEIQSFLNIIFLIYNRILGILRQSLSLAHRKQGSWIAGTNNIPPSTSSPPAEDILAGPSGMRDFYPSEQKVQNWLFDAFRETSQMFGFQEYDAPILEHVQLYERKAGEEIVDQLYQVVSSSDDNNNRENGSRLALRPEITPTLARMILNKTNLQTGQVRGLTLPLKWFSIPRCFRFETTQRGRKREFYQWNMDIVGVKTATAELELLAAACSFFQRVGLTSKDVEIKVSSRAVLEAILAKYGIRPGSTDTDGGDVFDKACIIIDKLDKIEGGAVTNMLGDIGVGADAAADILKSLKAKSIPALIELIGEETEAINQLKLLFEQAADYGIDDFLTFDASIVRGLSYYTGIVWEAFDRRGKSRAIMGGGRYDRLMELYGGDKCQIPCVGFGMGDCVIMDLLKKYKKLPNFQDSPGVDYVVCAYNSDMYGPAVKISASLRRFGWSVDLMTSPKKNAAAYKYAAKVVNARRMVFVAPNEIGKGVVSVKDLKTKILIDCPIDELETIDILFVEASQSSIS